MQYIVIIIYHESYQYRRNFNPSNELKLYIYYMFNSIAALLKNVETYQGISFNL